MATPIAETFVAINPDFTSFGPKVERGVRDAATAAEAEAKRAFSGVSTAAEESATKATSAFRDSSGRFSKNMSEVESAAKTTATGIERDMSGAASKSESSFKSIESSGTQHFNNLGASLRHLAELAVGVFAFHEVATALEQSLGIAREAAQLQRVTAAVVQSTGAAAHVTAGQIDEMARSLAEKTGVDHKQIESAENVLLTFRNVKDAGAGQAAVFDRTVTAALNLSTVMKSDVNGAMLQLGKALNDPIQGMTTLRRVGIQFTDQQKEQIKTLVASGNILGAQEIILDEVGRKVGGAAEAAADPMARLKIIAEDLKESLGTGLLTAIGPLADALGGLGTKLGPTLGALGKTIGSAITAVAPLVVSALGSLGPVFDAGGALFKVFATTVANMVPAITPILASLGKIFTDLSPTLTQIGGVVVTSLLPAFVKLAGALVPLIPPLLQLGAVIVERLLAGVTPLIAPLTNLATKMVGTKDSAGPLVKILTSLADVIAKIPVGVLEAMIAAFIAQKTVIGPTNNMLRTVQQLGGSMGFMAAKFPGVLSAFSRVQSLMPLVGAAFDTLLGPVGLVILAVAAVAAAAYLIVRNWGTIKEFFAKLWDDVKAHFADAGRVILAFATGGMSEVVRLIISHWDDIKGFFGRLWDDIKGIFDGAMTVIHTLVANWARVILAVMTGGLSELVGLITRNWSAIQSFIGRVIEDIWHGVQVVWDSIVNFVIAAPGRILGGITAAFNGIVTLVTTAWNTIWNTASTVLGDVINFATALPGRILSGITGGFASVVGFIGDKWNAVRTGAANMVGDVISFFTGLPGRIISAIPHFDSLLHDAGVALIRGLVNGLEEAGHLVWDKLKSIGESALNQVKHLFGIGSPSKVFHEIGVFLGQGLVNGIASMTKDVTASANKLAAAALVKMPAPQLASSATSQLALARATGIANGASNAANGGTSVVIAKDAIQMSFSGAPPTADQARRLGQAAGEGIADTLAKRQIAVAGRVA